MTALLPLAVPWLLTAVFLALNGRSRWVSWAAVLVLACVVAADIGLLLHQTIGAASPLDVVTGGWPRGVGVRLRVDTLSLFVAAISAGVLLAVTAHEARSQVRSRLLPGLMVALCSGLHGAFFTADLFNFYVFFEVCVVSSFVLAAYGYGKRETRGTFVYVVVNSFGSVLFLLGVAAVYYVAGTLDIADLSARGGKHSYWLAAVLVFAALAIKVGLFPFHGWVPVLYTHARPAVAAALAGALVTLGAYALLRLGFTVYDAERAASSTVLVVLGSGAAFYGAALAMSKKRPEEIAAYLAVAHSGYLVVALGVGGVHGMIAMVLGIAAGALDKAAMFLSLDSRTAARGRIVFIAVSSTAGMPLTLGFLFKIELILALLATDAAAVYLAMVLPSLIVLVGGAFVMWQRTGHGAHAPKHPGRPWAAAALVASTLALGAVPGPVQGAASSAAVHLIGGKP